MFDQAFVIAQGCSPHLEDGLSPLGVIPEHLRPFHPVIDFLYQ